MSRPKILLYLVHSETGQRYPIASDDVMIGRSAGDICFPQDLKLSAAHCRIFADGKKVQIQDLESGNGTYLDRLRLDPAKIYPFAPGMTLNVGQQEFKAQAPSRAKPMRKKSKKKKRGFDFQMLLAFLMVAAAGHIFLRFFSESQRPSVEVVEAPPALPSPFELVQKEMKETFSNYSQLGLDREAGRINDKDLAKRLRDDLIPGFTAVQTKLSVLKAGSEHERRKLEAYRNLVTALLKQVTSMAKFAETRNSKYSADVDRISKELEGLNAEVQKLNQRQPAANW